MNLRRTLLLWSIPIQKFMQRLHPPEPQTTYLEASEVMGRMQDGDILLSREAWHFTNLFIPGFWSHAAIYGRRTVIEAVAPVVQKVEFIDWAMRKHNWCVIRPRITEGRDVDELSYFGECAYEQASFDIGLPYDYLFSDSNKMFYCSELVYESWRKAWFWAGGMTRRVTWGEKTVTPDDFYNAKDKMEIFYEHRDK